MLANKEELFKELLKFQKAEKKAKKSRNEIEAQLEEIYGTDFEGKSKTFKEEGIGFSINLKKSIVYKLDQEAYKSIRSDIPKNLRPEKITFSVNEIGFEFLKKSKKLEEREAYLKFSDCVEIKNNKTSIKVEKIK